MNLENQKQQFFKTIGGHIININAITYISRERVVYVDGGRNGGIIQLDYDDYIRLIEMIGV